MNIKLEALLAKRAEAQEEVKQYTAMANAAAGRILLLDELIAVAQAPEPEKGGKSGK